MSPVRPRRHTSCKPPTSRKTIRVVVTATNATGSSAATSSQTAVVVGLPPANTVLPTISGTAQQGQTLTASNGTWTGSPTSFAYRWRDCDASGGACADIAGETAQSYAAGQSDVGHTLRVVVTATNAAGSTSATSSQTPVVVGLPPANTVLPTISGTAQQGQTLTASNGTWTAGPTSFAYRWRDCDASGGACADIAGETAQSYAAGQSDVGHTLRVVVTATNAAGSTSATSSQTSVVVGLAPVNTHPPAISGEAQEGSMLATTDGTWTGSDTSFTYQWRTCDGSGSNCSDLAGATSGTYQLRASDVGNVIRVVVTATNAVGSTATTSAPTPVVTASTAPTNTALPTISGTAQQGESLTAASGSWTGNPTTYAYQWRSCDAGGAACVDIGGATGSTYVAAPGDVGGSLRVAVTATNAINSTEAVSDPTPLVAALSAPANTAIPAISGTAQQGQTLNASNGSWTGHPTAFTLQWRTCDANGTNCSDIDGATAASYVVQGNDVGNTLVVTVTATNAASSTPATSLSTPPVVVAAPVNTALPTITGAAQQGQTLAAANGAWTGSPTAYTYRWQACDAAGANCADIAGATTSSYLAQASDAGKTIQVVVTATNAAGPTAATSAQTSVVAGLPPENTALPAISGTAQQGQTLTASNGTWTNSPTSFAYHWRTCDAGGTNCTDLVAATSRTYDLGAADAGATIRVDVTATNAWGSSDALSQPTDAVAALAAPTNATLPAISGTTQEGQTLTVSNGTWTGTPTSFAYTWRRCDAGGASCADLVGATSQSYTLQPADVGHTVRAVVTATNAAGSTDATSSQTSVVTSLPPTNTALPAITGTPQQGQTLTASNGSWTGSPTGYSYQWRSCDASGASCVDVAGATSQSYALQPADVGHTVRAVVTATNAAGSTDATSSQTSVVTSLPPTNTALPAITGTPQQGQTLAASTGVWTGSPTGYSYQWRSCDSSGASCVDLASATGTTYVPQAADVGKTIRVVVTATNAGGSTAATSAQSAAIAAAGSWSVSSSITNGQTLTGKLAWTATTSLPTSQIAAVDYSIDGTPRWTEHLAPYLYNGDGNTLDTTTLTNGTHTLTITATANDGTTATTQATITVGNGGGGGSAPANTALPAITGTPQQGQTLTASTGSWTNSPTGYSYQWRSCDSSGNSCTNLAGATAPTYTLQTADTGHTIRVVGRLRRTRAARPRRRQPRPPPSPPRAAAGPSPPPSPTARHSPANSPGPPPPASPPAKSPPSTTPSTAPPAGPNTSPPTSTTATATPSTPPPSQTAPTPSPSPPPPTTAPPPPPRQPSPSATDGRGMSEYAALP